MKILCKTEMSFRQNKEASICSVELLWQLFIMQIFKSREYRIQRKIWTLWPCERLTNSRLLKSWAGGMEVISFNYSVFVSYLTNVYGVGDWSDQIKKFQITLTRKSPVGWGLGRPHDLNMESIHRVSRGHGNIRDGASIVKIRHRRVKTSRERLWLNNVRCGCDASHSFNSVTSHNIEPTQRIPGMFITPFSKFVKSGIFHV